MQREHPSLDAKPDQKADKRYQGQRRIGCQEATFSEGDVSGYGIHPENSKKQGQAATDGHDQIEKTSSECFGMAFLNHQDIGSKAHELKK